MDENYRKALAEIDDIIKYSDKESKEKISEEFIKFVRSNKDQNYKTKINPKKKIEEQKIMYETKVILAVMYREFWATDEEKYIIDENIKLKEKENREEFEKTIKSEEEMFKKENKEPDVEKINAELNLMKNEKDNVFSKIVKTIKKLLHLD